MSKKIKDLINRMNDNNKGVMRELSIESKTIDEEKRTAQYV